MIESFVMKAITTHFLPVSIATLVAVFGIGCSPSNPQISLNTTPSGAFIEVNGENVGVAPQYYTFDFATQPTYQITASKAGYFTEVTQVAAADPRIGAGLINIVLEEDAAYQATTTSDAANRWLRIQVDASRDQADAWQTIMDSVTSVYSTVNTLDASAGYVRSTPKVIRFDRGPQGPFYVRTTFISTIQSRKPLVYKFQIQSETRLVRESDYDWLPYDRVFNEDAQMVQELQARLGLK